MTVTLSACGNQAEESKASSTSSDPSATSSPSSPSSSASPNAAQPKQISADEVNELISSGQEYTLVDVRQPDEFQQGHIPTAILIPDNELPTQAETKLPNKDATIIVYCRSGRRSAGAASTLAGLGYTNVNDLGGITSWPYDIVTD